MVGSGIGHDCMSVTRILHSKGTRECVVKTAEGTHGENVWVFYEIEFMDDDCQIMRFDGAAFKLSEILGKESLIFEDHIKLASLFASINPSSVNTIRFMTTKYPTGYSEIVAAFLKIGRHGKCVDNVGEGGNINAKIDITSGRLGNVIQADGFKTTKCIKYHPDTGVLIEGVLINGWEEIRNCYMSWDSLKVEYPFERKTNDLSKARLTRIIQNKSPFE